MTMRWNRSRWVPEGVGHHRLDGIGVGHGHDGLAGVATPQLGHGVDHAGLHAREGLSAGKPEAARIALHRRPLRKLHQLLQVGAGPLAEVALDQAPRHPHPQAEGALARGAAVSRVRSSGEA